MASQDDGLCPALIVPVHVPELVIESIHVAVVLCFLHFSSPEYVNVIKRLYKLLYTYVTYMQLGTLRLDLDRVGTHRDVQVVLWESGLFFSNAERADFCTVWRWRGKEVSGGSAGRQTGLVDSPLDSLGSQIQVSPQKCSQVLSPAPKKLIGFQIGRRFSMMIRQQTCHGQVFKKQAGFHDNHGAIFCVFL